MTAATGDVRRHPAINNMAHSLQMKVDGMAWKPQASSRC